MNKSSPVRAMTAEMTTTTTMMKTTVTTVTLAKTAVVMTAVSAILLMLTSNNALADRKTKEAEHKFRNVIGALLDNRTELAFTASQNLLKQSPDFNINRMVYADLLAALSHQQPLFGSMEAQQTRRVAGIREEIVTRFTYHAPQRGYLPAGIMRLSSIHRFALVLDAEASRLYVFKNADDTLTLIDDHYISIGKGGIGKIREGDGKTPLGLYHVNEYLPDEELIELYGAGAFTLNYPNPWDRLFERDGSGIWLHGMPRNLSSRPPQDSRGCVILNNQWLEKLNAYIDSGKTALLIESHTKWLPPDQWQMQKDDLLDTMRSWQRDWENLKMENYLSYYSKDYQTKSQNYEQMARQVLRNARKKTYVEVDIANLDLFAYPGEPNLVTAIFDQDYQSNNYSIKYRKQQFWRHEAGEWKIIYEGKAEVG